MEQFNRINRPANPVGGNTPVQGQAPSTHVPATHHVGNAPKKKPSKKLVSMIITVIIAIVVIAGIYVAVQFLFGRSSIASQIKTDKYQAVFLNSPDGQVYFGKLQVLNDDYYKLNDIYYVRVDQVQPSESGATTPNISLAKLGNEIHGPEDIMYIRKDDVMFWENLKDDGQVVTAIKEYISNGGQPQQTAPTPTNTPSDNIQE